MYKILKAPVLGVHLHDSVPDDEGVSHYVRVTQSLFHFETSNHNDLSKDPLDIDSDVARLRGMKPLGVAIGRGEKRYASPASDNLWLRSRRSQGPNSIENILA